MAEFLQSYGIWIFFGLLFLLMLRGHGHGMGCGMGGHQHQPKQNPGVEEKEGQPKSEGHSSGCHRPEDSW